MPLPATAIHTNCCGAWWTGATACHCAGCHQTFTSPTAFTKHRTVQGCSEPADIGLVPAARSWSGWSFPSEEGDRL